MAKNEETQVRFKKTTLENLKKIGNMGESYNDVVNRLIKKELKN